MNRVRVSTTVDAQNWAEARRLLNLPSSRIVDRALETLIDALEAQAETAALAAHPYEDDPDLNWDAQDLPDLPYDGEIPQDVKRLAAERRRKLK